MSLELGGTDAVSSPEPWIMSSPPSESCLGVSEPSGRSSCGGLAGGCVRLAPMLLMRRGELDTDACSTAVSQ